VIPTTNDLRKLAAEWMPIVKFRQPTSIEPNVTDAYLSVNSPTALYCAVHDQKAAFSSMAGAVR